MDKCPQCGYSEVVLPTSTAFYANEYVHEKTGKKSVIASKEEKVTGKDGVWVRSDLCKAQSTSVKEEAKLSTPTPVKPAEVKK